MPGGGWTLVNFADKDGPTEQKDRASVSAVTARQKSSISRFTYRTAVVFLSQLHAFKELRSKNSMLPLSFELLSLILLTFISRCYEWKLLFHISFFDRLSVVSFCVTSPNNLESTYVRTCNEVFCTIIKRSTTNSAL